MLLEFLVTEMMAARMVVCERPRHNINIAVTESPEAAALKKMLQSLGFPRPPDNITASQLWEKVELRGFRFIDIIISKL